MLSHLIFGAALLAPVAASERDATVVVSSATTDEHGFRVHQVQSPFQAGTTQIRVLLPDNLEPGRRYPVIFLLPVEAGRQDRYGDGLLEAKKQNLHNKHQVIFVAPTFSHLPWYADHPTDPAIRQELYFLKVVVPYIQANYPVVTGPRGLWLLGFSKSGWGAFSLLLRHPSIFGRAAAWDAPLMMDQPNRYGTGEIFGTQENFEKYQIARLMEQQAAKLGPGRRLILLGYDNFRAHHQQAHDLMTKLAIDHEHRDGPVRKHDWHSGWVAEAVGLLMNAPSEGILAGDVVGSSRASESAGSIRWRLRNRLRSWR